MKNYVWEWKQGGYNSCMATSLKEAEANARKLGGARLTPVNVRVDADYRTVMAYDRMYAGQFD